MSGQQPGARRRTTGTVSLRHRACAKARNDSYEPRERKVSCSDCPEEWRAGTIAQVRVILPPPPAGVITTSISLRTFATATVFAPPVSR
jgi:hypothetical protein